MPHSLFDDISPLNVRYVVPELLPWLSDGGFTGAKLKVEEVVALMLVKMNLCSPEVGKEISDACRQVSPEEVALEEAITHHDVQALVNCIKARVSNDAKPFVHWMMTSYDVVDTANAYRYKNAIKQVTIPFAQKLLEALCNIAISEAETPQVGRTHGQHAVPTTFGYAIAGYAQRLSDSISRLRSLADLQFFGKLSGAVGAYNAAVLVMDAPRRHERSVLAELGLAPADGATQIVPPEGSILVFLEVTMLMGIVADLANDMRQLQRTELAEVCEEFQTGQIGSSAMPQKHNPVKFENTVSIGRIVRNRASLLFEAQQSEHQRDLTNSAASRTYGEIIAYVTYALKQMNTLMRKLKVDRAQMLKNLHLKKGEILAEALRTLLAKHGHPQALEATKSVVERRVGTTSTLLDVFACTPELDEYRRKMKSQELHLLDDPALYTGLSADEARRIGERLKRSVSSEALK